MFIWTLIASKASNITNILIDTCCIYIKRHYGYCIIHDRVISIWQQDMGDRQYHLAFLLAYIPENMPICLYSWLELIKDAMYVHITEVHIASNGHKFWRSIWKKQKLHVIRNCRLSRFGSTGNGKRPQLSTYKALIGRNLTASIRGKISKYHY